MRLVDMIVMARSCLLKNKWLLGCRVFQHTFEKFLLSSIEYSPTLVLCY